MKTDDGAPFHLGSESGKICPISGSPKAPNIASTTQWSKTSPANPNQRLKINKYILKKFKISCFSEEPNNRNWKVFATKSKN